MSTLGKTYQKKTDIEHILDAPDTYIGAVEPDETRNWTFSQDGDLIFTKLTWTPGLYKCFDEGIVNARDHKVRMDGKKGKNNFPVKAIEVTVNKKTGIISIFNDGNGIDIAKHPEYKIWIPEMIFGHLRTSTNYDKTQKRIVGGKNGFGFKLVLIYSKWGRIETVDHTRKKRYIQEFQNNLSIIRKPKISRCTGAPYTRVSFLPDYERFGLTSLTDDMFYLFKKRTYDIAAITDRSVKVKFNDQSIPIRQFENYISLFIGQKSETKRVYERNNARWEFAVCLSPMEEFTHVSYVNGIYTGKGGKHVDYILGQITRKLVTYIEKKKKIRVKPVTIKEQIMLFINCVIENPTFDSQTKDFMNLPTSKFGSACVVSDKFIDKVAKMGVMETAINLNEIKDHKAARKTDGKKSRSVRGVPKLIDANFAGTAKSHLATLILCEGDSAKAGIVSGLNKYDRDTMGVFPLRGKLPNVKDASQLKINQNAEITAIKKILGLETNKVYKTAEDVKEKLRYGNVIFMTDQDLDGSHIKGLCINIFHSLWRDLFKLKNFIGFMNTPILKAKKGKRELSFYNEAEYEKWKLKELKGWNIKYYKGLGTSTSKEFKEYFAKKKIVGFEWRDDRCDDNMDMVFNKKRADDRKTWLGTYKKGNVLDTNRESICYTDFINREMIHFSKYDCDRSIPNVNDGLKTSQRKILFAAFKRKLTKEVKVAQFSGYVSEHSCYHHGETSLQKAIVGMAQDHVGSNNINLLLPNGQFGTRLAGGKDSASERYIFTALSPITQYIYNVYDQPILNYLEDDGTPVEPEFYSPIIPMILVNGSKGIGTGFSTDIPQYKPQTIINYLLSKLKGKDVSKIELLPFYRGFKGTIQKVASNKFLVKGIYKILSATTVHITELPVGLWTDDYKEFLDKMIDKKNSILKSVKEVCTEKNIDITITLTKGALLDLLGKVTEYGCNLFEKKFRLYTTRNTGNMHLFNRYQRMTHYKTASDIIEDYYPVRLEFYRKRKEYLLKNLEAEVKVLHNKARFIEEQCDDVIDLRRKKKDIIIKLLSDRKYDIVNQDKDYKYLRTMRIEQVEEENIIKLRALRDKKKEELKILQSTSIKRMWNRELKKLYRELQLLK